jgi:hypothetical protein
MKYLLPTDHWPGLALDLAKALDPTLPKRNRKPWAQRAIRTMKDFGRLPRDFSPVRVGLEIDQTGGLNFCFSDEP